MVDLIQENKEWIDSVWRRIDEKLQVISVRSRDKLPYTTINGTHDNRAATGWWTNGFWPGLMWLMYQGTGNEQYKETARRGQKLLNEALKNYEALHHDVGFMWHLASSVDYILTGNQEAKQTALYVASTLASRYNLNGHFIRAWNGGDRKGWVIIDCMMNIPLLYWASRELDDPRFKYIAMSHADNTIKSHIRPDGSVNHIVNFDIETGEILENIGGQGYEVGSSWSRGQAWALYGYILSYIHTGKQDYMDVAKRVAHYFIANIREDATPLVDFRAPDEPKMYDTTAGACAACGLIEIANNVTQYEKKLYLGAAIDILKSLEREHVNWSLDEDSILQDGTEAYHSKKQGVEIPIIFGDYFFAEAFYKLKELGPLFW